MRFPAQLTWNSLVSGAQGFADARQAQTKQAHPRAGSHALPNLSLMNSKMQRIRS